MVIVSEIRENALDAHLHQSAFELDVRAVQLVVEAEHVDARNHLASLPNEGQKENIMNKS